MNDAIKDIEALLKIIADDCLTDDDPDEDSVGWDGDGVPLPMTFGHIRRAQRALQTLKGLVQ